MHVQPLVHRCFTAAIFGLKRGMMDQNVIIFWRAEPLVLDAQTEAMCDAEAHAYAQRYAARAYPVAEGYIQTGGTAIRIPMAVLNNRYETPVDEEDCG